MLHHQTWLADEMIRNRAPFSSTKDFPQRVNPVEDLNLETAKLHSNAWSSASLANQQRSMPMQIQYKQHHPFNTPYPYTSAVYAQTLQNQQQQQKYSRRKQSPSESPQLPKRSVPVTTLSTSIAPIHDLNTIGLSASGTGSSSNENVECGHSETTKFKDSLQELLQQRQTSDISVIRSYSQLLLSNSIKTPTSFTDTSSCKEKSSSSSTSSTPPLTSSLITQHQQLSRMLKSPSETSLFNEQIEEETKCIVCNAHFPNVWLLEQHAALQHPILGPGEEKPFICEQCGQSYRYRSAYAKHKEQNHRARLPADKLFTCDVCGMQFRYLKSFKKHRLNHALERLHGKKGTKYALSVHSDHEIVTSSQELMIADEGEDLRVNVKREPLDEENGRELEQERDEQIEIEQDSTIDSACVLQFNDNNSSTSNSTNLPEYNITSTDISETSNKRQRVLQTQQLGSDPSYHLHFQHQLLPHLHTTESPSNQDNHTQQSATTNSLSSLSSLNSITSLINAERLPSEQFLGLNPQEASILNFLRVDAAERQRDKRPLTSRFACPFCGKCVRSKENLKLHVRKHTGERPFVCLFCGRAFGGKSDLTRHLRIHTGERPYHCESCGKCFARADYLSKHLTTHVHNAPR